MINVAKFGQKSWLCHINLSDCWVENDVPIRFQCNRKVRKTGVIIYTFILLWLCIKVGVLSSPPQGAYGSPRQDDGPDHQPQE